jgi:hypothetical protein
MIVLAKKPDLGGFFKVGEFFGDYGVCIHFDNRSIGIVLFGTSVFVPFTNLSAFDHDCIALNGIFNLKSHFMSILLN